MQPEKIDLTHTSISEERLAQLRDLLPEVFHEGTINWDELRNALGDYVEDDPHNERFGLRWPGKSKLQQVINTPSVGTLVPQPEVSVDWDTTGNVIIEGDNLEVLKLLQKSYAGKIKMIYIDPPYNTGNDFVYPDKYASGLDTYLEFTGQLDEDGRKTATNSESGGRYHANWLNMMYPRLYLARNLLRNDGVVLVSIDDAELPNCIGLLDLIMGEENYVGTFAVIRSEGGGLAKQVVIGHDYMLVYSRDISKFDPLKRPKDIRGRVVVWNGDEYWIEEDWLRREFGSYGTAYYDEIEALKGPDKKKEIDGKIQSGEYVLIPKEDSRYIVGRLRHVASDSSKFYSVIKHLNKNGQDDLEAIAFSDAFDYPKPVSLIKEMILGVTFGSRDQQDIILDFFAGSGTTGHAVMQQNAEDGGNRKFILVQLPEPMETKVLDDGTELNTIADICRERVCRAGRKIQAELTPSHGGGGVSSDTSTNSRSESLPARQLADRTFDTGFRAYKLAPSNFTPWDGSVDTSGLMTSARQASFMPETRQLSLEQRLMQAAEHLHPDTDDLAILTEFLLKLGEELTVSVETLSLAGKTVYDIDHNLRLICLDRNLTLDVIREMAARQPAEIIGLDAGFPDDQTKVNAGQIIATQANHAEGSIAFKVV